MTMLEHYQQELTKRSKTDPKIAALRSRAMQQFIEQGLPKNEDWKYTRLDAFAEKRFASETQTAVTLDRNLLDKHRMTDAIVCVFINGVFAPDDSDLTKLDAAITIQSMADARAAAPDTWLPLLETPHPNDRFYGIASLQQALSCGGYVIDIPEKVVIDTPIQCLFVSTQSDTPQLLAPSNIIRLGAQARAVLIEKYLSVDAADYAMLPVTQIHLSAQSQLRFAKVIAESDRAFHLGQLAVWQAKNAQLYAHLHTYSGACIRSDVNTVLQAEGAEANLYGLFVGSASQHIDQHTTIDHAMPYGISKQFYKGILGDSARGVFNGKIIVRPHAHHTDSQQTNKNVLLSNTAEIDTKPELEIYADDVSCTHGATVGQISESELFYLQSRGIDAAEARSLLMYAFANDIIHRVQHEGLRTYLNQELIAHLPALLSTEGLF